MTERANRTPAAKSWADDIDDLYHDAIEKSLRAMSWTRTRRTGAGAEAADDSLLGTGSVQRGVAAGGKLQ